MLPANPVVVLWGDHGWKLGEHTLWCDHSCYETSMRIPLIVRAPSIKPGQRRSHLVESIDLHPTLCALTDLDPTQHLQGRSLAKLLNDPTAPWKPAANGRFQNGDTIRTDQFRFTEYSNRSGQPTSRMLCDHSTDPHENVNVSESQAEAAVVLKEELHQQMGHDAETAAAP